MLLGKYNVGLMHVNCYILADKKTSEAVIIDPAGDVEKISADIESKGLKIVAILLTHAHFDHILGLEEMKKKFNVPIYVHEDEAFILRDAHENFTDKFCKEKIEAEADKYFKDGDIFVFGDNIELKVIKTPGHTPGSVCYYNEKENVLISGDTLFYRSIGRSDFPHGNQEDLINSIQEKLFILPDETKVYPGHNDMTTIGDEKEYNPIVGF